MRLPACFLSPLLALALVSCVGRGGLDSNFGAVEFAGPVVVDVGGERPYSGRLVARDAEVAQLAGHLFQGTAHAALAELDTRGLIVALTLVEGRPEGPVQLYADTASKVWEGALEGRFGRLSAAAIETLAAELEIGEARFEAGKLEGEAKLYMPSPSAPDATQVFVEAHFEQGQLHGRVRQYFSEPAAVVSRELSFARGVLEGPQRSYYRSGQLERELSYLAGQPEGLEREYYMSGAPRAERSHRGGELVGTAVRWYPDGQLEERVEFVEGGELRTSWYSNGNMKSQGSALAVVDHLAQGDVREYYASGALRLRAHFEAGQRHGSFERFYSDGSQWEQASYANDLQVGAHRKWWKNGQLALEATWEEGVKQGSSRRWYASGQLWEQASYDAGELTGHYQKWWKNGALAHDYRYVAGKLDGPYRTFYDSGAKWAVGEYVAGKAQGSLRRWFPDGRLGFVKEHEGGRPHGVYQRWWADGSPRLDAHYERGHLHGEFHNWLEDGSIYEDVIYERGRKLSRE